MADDQWVPCLMVSIHTTREGADRARGRVEAVLQSEGLDGKVQVEPYGGPHLCVTLEADSESSLERARSVLEPLGLIGMKYEDNRA